MAERRMISKNFINSATFMKMSDSAKLLYFYLNVNADDDGIVEVFPYYKMLSIPEDDVRNLAEKKFIVFLNNDMLSFLPHWLQNNQLRLDRYRPSVHRNMLLNRFPRYIRNLKDVKREQLDKSIQTEDLLPETATILGVSTNGIPEVATSDPQCSIEKDRIVKSSIDKYSLVKVSKSEFEKNHENIYKEDTTKDRLFNMETTVKEDVLIATSDVYSEISPKDSTQLLRLIEKYNNDLIIEAFAISKGNSAKTINYTFKILQDFEKKGITNRQNLIESENIKLKDKFIKSEYLPDWIEPIIEKTEREKRIYKIYLAEKAMNGSLTLKKLYDDQLLDLIGIVILKRWLVREKNNK